MLFLFLALAILGSALVILAVTAGSRVLATQREHEDAPSIRSLATFHVLGDAEALGELLASIAQHLDAAGADTGSFEHRDDAFELDGTLGESAFRLTITRLDEDDETAAYMLLLHARTLGRLRYVAPPANATTRALLSAIDLALESSPDVHGLSWRTRQDQPSLEP